MKKLRVGMVGCSGIANNKHLPAMKAGKHVMCEKAKEKTFKVAKMIGKTAKETSKILIIGCQNLYCTDSAFLKRACANGDLEDVYYPKVHAIRQSLHGVYF